MAETPDIKDHSKTNYLRQFWICTALVVVTTAVYYQVCTYDFVNYDDSSYVYQNPNIQGGITLKSIKWAFTTGHCSNWHPLIWLSLMLDWQLFGLNAGGYHFTNLVFHIANTLLLFIVLKEMTNAVWQSAFVAALFALHPLHVESVAWVSERKDVLSTFFWLLTMWAYLRYVNHPKIGRYLLIVVFLALGLMSKPMLVTMPFVLLLLDYWPLARLKTRRSLPYLLIEKIPLFAVVIASSIVTFIVQKKSQAVTEFVEFPLRFRIYNALISYVQYIIKMIWPVKLAMFYPHPGQNVSILFAVISAIILLAATIFVLLFSKKHRYLFTGWFWYLGMLAPVIGIVQAGSQAMADRYSYITLTGLFIIIAWGLPELLGKWPYRRRKIALWASSIIVLSAFAVQAHIQQHYWKDSISLCEHAIKVTSHNYQAYCSISGVLIAQGRADEAIRYADEAIRIAPNYVQALNNLGIALQMTGKIDKAVYYYNKAIEIEPNKVDAYINLGIALAAKGKLNDAISLYNKALQIAPESLDLHTNFGAVLAKIGRADEAIKEYQKGLQIKPDNPDVLDSLGLLFFQQEKTDESFKYFSESLRLDHDRPLAHYYIGQILAQRGKVDDAILHFEDALRLEPNWVKPMNDLAWFLAVSGKTKAHNPDRAIKLALKACEITNYTKYELLDTLAAAYASAGNFSKAIEIIEKALELCRSDEQKAVKEELEKRLALYKAGKPYIER